MLHWFVEYPRVISWACLNGIMQYRDASIYTVARTPSPIATFHLPQISDLGVTSRAICQSCSFKVGKQDGNLYKSDSPPLPFPNINNFWTNIWVPLRRSNMFTVYTQAAIFENSEESLTFRAENPTSGGVPAETSNSERGNSHFLWLLQ